MPHVPYAPRPVPSKTPIMSPMAPLSSAAIAPDLAQVPEDIDEEASDGFLDDFPVSSGPKRSKAPKRPQIVPGKPRRREIKDKVQRSAMGSISMATFQAAPAHVAGLMGMR